MSSSDPNYPESAVCTGDSANNRQQNDQDVKQPDKLPLNVVGTDKKDQAENDLIQHNDKMENLVGKKKRHRKKETKKDVTSTDSADVLLPGAVLNPEVNHRSGVKGNENRKGQQMDVRPKSGGRSAKTPDVGSQSSPRDGQGSKSRPNSGRSKPNFYKNEQTMSSGSMDRYSNNNGRQSPYRQEQRTSQGRQEGQRGKGQSRQTPKGNNNGNRGNNSSENQRGQRGKQTSRQPMCEPYLSNEELQKGLKLGNIIQGQIRINPKNYEEAYIPHPDGVSDIFISGMKDRNRALNGDIVAVLLNDRTEWKVSTNNLKDLEERHEEQNRESCSTPSKPAGSNVSNTTDPETPSVTAPVATYTVDSDSEPDVIIESEEIIDLTGNDNSKSKSETSNSTSVVKGISNQGAISQTHIENEGEKIMAAEGNVQDISDRLENMEIKSKDKKHHGHRQKQDKNDGRKTKDGNKGNNCSAQKKYSTLGEIIKDGSPVIKNLFTLDVEEQDNHIKRVVQRTGKVVGIIERKHSRASTGQLTLMNDKNPNMALFKPLDHRLPRIMIPMDNCPKDFFQRPEDHANTLFICRITDWAENSMYAQGELMRSLGEAGEIEPETEGILIENDVDYSEFTEEALSSLPVHELPWSIPEEEIGKRRDFRQQCVFTIDPATARDLDDALSCEKLDDGTYNVGVHIADVTYFLKEETELDKRARFRATSVYLIQKVIPMLPRILCEELCSLNPNQDRLTFSVVWNMSEEGEIYGEWFGRSVIRSCVKLSYDHAQGFIEEPEREWTQEELPTISDNYPISQIKETVLNLQKIAKNLRKARFDDGALRLDQVKLQFTLDKDTGMPNGYQVYRQKDSNRLVEEFMLLANMAVAHKIKKHYPQTAFLRRHPPPQSKMVEDLVELCNNLGFPIDATSAGSLQKSLWRHAGNDEMSVARMQVLVSMCSKPMQNAKYFCTGCIDDEELYRHYALNVPLYTHFTSPIRRYADVMVHRTLAASLGYCPPTDFPKTVIQGIADNCNDRKTNSKRASELSSELYFAVFVKTAGPFEERGMVMGVFDKAFDVFILKFGVTKRVYCDKLALKDKLYTKEQKNPVLTLYWESGQVQKISVFTVVTCVLKAGELPLQWMATIKPPKE